MLRKRNIKSNSARQAQPPEKPSKCDRLVTSAPVKWLEQGANMRRMSWFLSVLAILQGVTFGALARADLGRDHATIAVRDADEHCLRERGDLPDPTRGSCRHDCCIIYTSRPGADFLPIVARSADLPLGRLLLSSAPTRRSSLEEAPALAQQLAPPPRGPPEFS